ncbi:response regulator transcription factor [Haloplanus salilacus]|uniref:response regulator transcription factor n=1 Tax=Haloplanus salilacus TaxID=2949994 RepID=UPI0030D52AB5
MSDETPTVLVVEDERDLAELYTTWLAESYHVRTAGDGREALDELDEDVSVVLLDRRMHDLSGEEVLEAIRDRSIDCRVAMVTAVEPGTEIVDMAFDDYLVKPVSRDDIERTVSNLLVRNEYDEGIRQLFSLASKKALLESETNPTAPVETEEYHRLLDDIDELRAELDDKLDRLGEDGDLTAVYRDLARDLDEKPDD